MDNYTFNSDKFLTWHECRKKYYLKYIKEIKVPQIENQFELGKSVHALINYYLRGFDVKPLLKNASDDIKQAWNVITSSNFLSANNVFLTEWQFNCSLKNTEYWLSGRIDAVFYDGLTSKYTIVDWKTGQTIPKNAEMNPQTILYLYSFFKAQNDLKISFKQDDLAFEYVKISECITTKRVNYSAKLENIYEDYLIATLQDIENELEYNRTDCCTSKFCEYANICQNI